MSQMSLNRKVTIAFAILAVFIGLTGFLSIQSLAYLRQASSEISDIWLPSNNKSSEINLKILTSLRTNAYGRVLVFYGNPGGGLKLRLRKFEIPNLVSARQPLTLIEIQKLLVQTWFLKAAHSNFR